MSWAALLAGVVKLLGAIAEFWRDRQLIDAGRATEKSESQAQILKDMEKRHEIDAAVAREPDPAGKLRDGWSRD